MTNILVDTNVILDVLLVREDFYFYSSAVLGMCADKEILCSGLLSDPTQP